MTKEIFLDSIHTMEAKMNEQRMPEPHYIFVSAKMKERYELDDPRFIVRQADAQK